MSTGGRGQSARKSAVGKAPRMAALKARNMHAAEASEGAAEGSSNRLDSTASGVVPSAGAQANNQREEQLVAMGFRRAKAKSALKRANGDLNQAMNFLVNSDEDNDNVPELGPDPHDADDIDSFFGKDTSQQRLILAALRDELKKLKTELTKTKLENMEFMEAMKREESAKDSEIARLRRGLWRGGA